MRARWRSLLLAAGVGAGVGLFEHGSVLAQPPPSVEFGGGGHVIQDEGADVDPQAAILNFVGGGVDCQTGSDATKTRCTIGTQGGGVMLSGDVTGASDANEISTGTTVRDKLEGILRINSILSAVPLTSTKVAGTANRCARFNGSGALVPSDTGDCLNGDTTGAVTLAGDVDGPSGANVLDAAGVRDELEPVLRINSLSSAIKLAASKVTATSNRCAYFDGTGALSAASGNCAAGDTGGDPTLGGDLSGTASNASLDVPDVIGEIQSSLVLPSIPGNLTPNRIDGAASDKCAKFDIDGILVAATGDCAAGDTGGGGGALTTNEYLTTQDESDLSADVFPTVFDSIPLATSAGTVAWAQIQNADATQKLIFNSSTNAFSSVTDDDTAETDGKVSNELTHLQGSISLAALSLTGIVDNQILVGVGSSDGEYATLQDCNDVTGKLDWDGSAFQCRNDAADLIDDLDNQSATTTSESGLEFVANELGLLRGCGDNEVLKWREATGDWGCSVDIGAGAGTPIIVDLGNNGSNESTNLAKIVTDTDTNAIFTVPSANLLKIDLTKDWPKADTADDLTCSGCIGQTEVADEFLRNNAADQTTGTLTLNDGDDQSGDVDLVLGDANEKGDVNGVGSIYQDGPAGTQPWLKTSGCGAGTSVSSVAADGTITCTPDIGGCIELSADDITCSGAAGCTAETIDGGNGHSFMVANFEGTAGATDDYGSWRFRVPTGWTGSQATVTFEWIATDADCSFNADDDVCWTIDAGSVGNNANFKDPALNGEMAAVRQVCLSPNVLLRAVRTDFIHGLVDGELGVVVVHRDLDSNSGASPGCAADSDEYPEPAKLVAVRICKE